MTSNGSRSVLSCQNILTHPRGGGGCQYILAGTDCLVRLTVLSFKVPYFSQNFFHV